MINRWIFLGIGDGDSNAARKDCFLSVLEGFRASLIQDIMQAFCNSSRAGCHHP
jgi:hypothetical protein